MTGHNSTLILLIAAAVQMISACGQHNNVGPRFLTAKIVSKNDETPFYTRLATSDERLIIGDAASSSGGVTFQISDGYDLYSVELDSDQPSKLDSEIYRRGNLRIFTAQDEREAFLIAGKVYTFAHPRKVDLTEAKQPSAMVTMIAQPADVTSALSTGPVTIDPARMREDLESLSGARPILVDGQSFTLTNRATSDNKTKARAWLKTIYESIGYKVIEHRYSSGINLIAEKRPANPVDDQIMMVSGHMDTVQTAGADDDGSGIISSLTIARALASKELKRTIRFVAFDEEERGLVGSEAYAKELNKTGEISKISLINIEMTGYDSDNDGDFHTIDCNENSSPSLSNALLNAISSEGVALKKVDACTNRSDHAVFWEYNRPAIVISQNFFGGDGNPCYHRTCDTVQKVNWDYMEKLTRAAASALYGLTQ